MKNYALTYKLILQHSYLYHELTFLHTITPKQLFPKTVLCSQATSFLISLIKDFIKTTTQSDNGVNGSQCDIDGSYTNKIK